MVDRNLDHLLHLMFWVLFLEYHQCVTDVTNLVTFMRGICYHRRLVMLEARSLIIEGVVLLGQRHGERWVLYDCQGSERVRTLGLSHRQTCLPVSSSLLCSRRSAITQLGASTRRIVRVVRLGVLNHLIFEKFEKRMSLCGLVAQSTISI
jgi:hypothetical protein